MGTFITSIAIANPPHQISQHDALEFMRKAQRLDAEEANHLKVLYRASGIQTRYTVLEDYKPNIPKEFFPNTDTLDPFPTTKSRMDLFRKEALKLSVEASKKALDGTNPHDITHLITVSCTGMYAPGIDIELVDILGLQTNVERTGVNFMGCYAAISAIKVANAICSSNPEAVVLVVCVELCSIHFQKEKTEDYLLANALFGDGAAALIIRGQPAKGFQLKIRSFYNDLYREGEQEMAWKIGDFGFEMRLSAYVPDVIESGISTLLNRLKARSGINEFQLYAIHPGGRKILQVIESELNISKNDNRFAYEVLQEYGNMSSPTILFVLKKLWNARAHTDVGKNILCLAFGPGLTIESMVLTIESH